MFAQPAIGRNPDTWQKTGIADGLKLRSVSQISGERLPKPAENNNLVLPPLVAEFK